MKITNAGENPVLIRRVRDPYGWLGNMSPYQVPYDGKVFFTTEHLYQWLKIPPEQAALREEVRQIKSPMGAKMTSKTWKGAVPDPEVCLDLMRMVLRLKLRHHPELVRLLRGTGERVVIEDCTRRQRGSGLYWGAADQGNGTWLGENWLGVLWMEIRAELPATQPTLQQLMGGEGDE